VRACHTIVAPVSAVEAYKANAARYESEKAEIAKEAKALDEQSAWVNEEGARVMTLLEMGAG
jgi:hypothetical protein